MTNNYIFIISIIIVFISSCKQETERTYYTTGELRTERYLENEKDSISYFFEFFKNGQIKQEGFVKSDTIMDGPYKLYYEDGRLLWSGMINNGEVQDEYLWRWSKCEKCFEGIEIEGDPDSLIENNLYRFRIIMPKVHPRFYSACDNNYKSLVNPDKDISYTYPYIFQFSPDKNGVFTIRIVFMDKNGNFIIGNPSIEYRIEQMYNIN